MDVFNPRFANEFLQAIMLKDMKEPMQGYWLKDNIPVISGYLNQKKEPYNIPYRPGNAFNESTLKTLPEKAMHEV
jgi:hypothetical protein